ncbi:LPS export ABC transporter periplasmic protein LptC, partial [candidate division CSSED10-310 bacterium]
MIFKKITLSTLFLVIIISLCLVFAIYILKASLYSNNNRHLPAKLESNMPDMVMEPFEYTNYDKNGQKLSFITAAKFKGFLQDNTYVLEQVTKAIFWQKDGTEVQARADEGTFEEQTQNVTLTGNVEIVVRPAREGDQPITFLSNDITYTNETGIFETQSPVKVLKKDFEIQGTGMILDRQQQKVWIQQDVSTTFPYELQTKQLNIPVHVTAQKAYYQHQPSEVHYYGQVQVRSAKNILHAAEIHIYLEPDQNRIECVGQVEATLIPQT